MSREHSRDIIRIHTARSNKKHSVPRRLCELIESFKVLDFVDCVGVGRYRYTDISRSIKIHGFDDNRKSYIVDIYAQGYEQRLFIRILDKQPDYEDHILTHFSTFYKNNSYTISNN